MELRTLIVGNWKSNPRTEKEAVALYSELSKEVPKHKSIETIYAVPFVFLPILKKKFPKTLFVAQDVSAFDGGAHTGEIAATQLASAGAVSVIIGHSETRASGVTNTDTREKIQRAIKAGLSPILCVGETVRDEGHEYLRFVANQITEALLGMPKAKLASLTIAYEPVWAIGKDAARVATPEESLEMSIFIRRTLADMFDKKSAESVRIIYGGSVDEKNGISFLKHGGVSGLLPGRLSLSPKKFAALIRSIIGTL